LKTSSPRSNINGGQTVFVCNENNEKYIFNLPRCITNEGILGVDKKSIKVETPNSIHVGGLDEIILNHAVENSIEWFKKTLDKKTLRLMYNPILKDTKWRVRVPMDDVTKSFNGGVFNNKNERIDIHDVCLETETFDAVIQLVGIYFIPGEFGLSWKLLQLKVHPRTSLNTYAFNSDEDDASDAEPN
jgi:hypothetical protein